MVLEHLRKMSDKDFRIVKQVANQLAGRKPRRGHLNYNVQKQDTDRRHQNPFKDIAKAHRNELISWIKEDGHTRNDAGELGDAFRKTLHTLHRAHVAEVKKGGSIDFIRRTGSTLHNLGKTYGAQADILADDFLSKVGLRKRRYTSAEVDEQTRLHARLALETYKGADKREAVDGWAYNRDHSTDHWGVYEKDGHRIIHARGTDPGQALFNSDLANDAQIAVGDHPSIGAGDLKHKIKQLLDESGDGNVSLSGYSLGGSKMLSAALNDSDIHSRISDKNVVISPGFTAASDRRMANLDKMQYVYHAHDAVANNLLQHSTDNHKVHYDANKLNPVDYHTEYLKDLAK